MEEEEMSRAVKDLVYDSDLFNGRDRRCHVTVLLGTMIRSFALTEGNSRVDPDEVGKFMKVLREMGIPLGRAVLTSEEITFEMKFGPDLAFRVSDGYCRYVSDPPGE